MIAFQTDLEVYIDHLDKLIKDFKVRFWDLDDMHFPEWLVTPFDMKINTKCHE